MTENLVQYAVIFMFTSAGILALSTMIYMWVARFDGYEDEEDEE